MVRSRDPYLRLPSQSGGNGMLLRTTAICSVHAGDEGFVGIAIHSVPERHA